ncbi:translation initiation factor IF-2 subunit alpha [Nanoarchaeota archaeon]
MLYRREGFPEEDEFVFCTVTKIFHSSVFVNLDEFDKSGMIHISEIAPGRIRNIRDYVTPGKKIVCKVLRLDQAKGHIDLSLRRVSDAEKKRKSEEIKQEQKAEKIIEMAAKEIKEKMEDVYDKVADKVFENYPYLHVFFKEMAEEKAKIETLGLDKKLTGVLKDLIADKFKAANVIIKGVFELKSYDADGVSIVKKVLMKAEKNEGVTISYIGGGSYQIKVESKTYKEAEKILSRVEESVLSDMRKHQGEGVFKRE